MKKLFNVRTLLLLLAVCLISIPAIASGDKPEITFSETRHEFGTIKASAGTGSATYRFTNTGSAPLVIITVTNGGCGCTTPSYPKHPIAPGKSGEITIHFDPSGRRGEFNREVKVKTNASKKRIGLRFSGAIIP